jgi:hypothetical protein
MATIAGLSCTFGLPESDEREQNVSLGQAGDGSWKRVKFADSKRASLIPLHGLSTADKTTLENIVENSSNQQVKVVSDSHINLGAGNGAFVRLQIMDNTLDFQKDNHEKWGGDIYCGFVSAIHKLKIDSIHFLKIDSTNKVEIQ